MTAQLQADLADLARRRQNLLDQIEEYEPTGNHQIDRDFRRELHTRYVATAIEYETKANQLTELTARSSEPHDSPEILERLPVVEAAYLVNAPEELLRALYEKLQPRAALPRQ